MEVEIINSAEFVYGMNLIIKFHVHPQYECIKKLILTVVSLYIKPEWGEGGSKN